MFFNREKNIIFSELEKNLGIYFDSELAALSNGEVFRAIWALWEALEQKGFFPLNLKSGRDSPNDIVWPSLRTEFQLKELNRMPPFKTERLFFGKSRVLENSTERLFFWEILPNLSERLFTIFF